MHEQTGCACTFIGFGSRPFVSPSFESTAGDPRRYLRQWDKALPFKKEHISIWFKERQSQMWMVVEIFIVAVAAPCGIAENSFKV